ncbi:aldehyde ferredoxin oxidoreductase family protein, partial [Thermodesulfobacteriota bacterium]
ENLVRYACVRTGLKNAAGRTGMGAVMGSKNLKAVAARGTLDIRVSDPRGYRTYYLNLLKQLMRTKWVQSLSKNGTPLLFRTGNAAGFLSIRNNQETSAGEEGFRLGPYSTGMMACYSCPAHCRHRITLKTGPFGGFNGEGPEYASLGSLGTKLGNLDLESILHAVEACNRYGLDTISTGSYIAWAMELFQRGILDLDKTGIPLEWGNGEIVLEMLRKITFREGFGDILAEGSLARAAFGDESGNYLLEIKDLPIEMTDERLPKSFALGLATSTRGACHMRSRPSIDVLGLPEKILEKVYGGPVSSNYASYRGKGRMVWWHERLNALADSLGVCRFLTAFSSPHGLQYRHFSRLIRLLTGIRLTPEELRTTGERICTIERAMLVKEGMTRANDTLPKRYFDEPVADGPAKGAVINRKDFDFMLDDYYGLHGWDMKGIPRKRTLRRLGIEP